MQKLLGAKELLELLELERTDNNNSVQEVQKPTPNKGKMYQVLAIINQYIAEPIKEFTS